jgi:hypothetical protein
VSHLPRVRLYSAAGCSLCVRALEVIEGLRAEVEFDFDIVDIGDRPDLGSQYRELLPVVEIDGRQTFTYFVDVEALRSRLDG